MTKDGIVDRIQVLKYPPGGSLETHCDPYHIRELLYRFIYTRGAIVQVASML